MSMEKLISELDAICDFLKGHIRIENASYALTNEEFTITIQMEEDLPGLRIWASHISSLLEKTFQKPVKIKYNCPDGTETQVNTDSDVTAVQKKLIGKTTYVFCSFDNKYRLLRVEPDRKTFDSTDMYYQSNAEISDTEIKNINQIFQLAADDHRSGKYIQNIMELNVNNIKTPDIYNKFAFAFRQIPKQFTERFIISLVRVPIQQDPSAINKAIRAFRKLINPVYISLELDQYLASANKVAEWECDGFVITVGNPRRKDISGILRKSNLKDLEKTVLLVYYTRDWKEIPSLHNSLIPMYMKTKVTN